MIQKARRITGKGGRTNTAAGAIMATKGKCTTPGVPPSDFSERPLVAASIVSANTGNVRTYVVGRYDNFGVPPCIRRYDDDPWCMLAIWRCQMTSVYHHTFFSVNSLRLWSVGGMVLSKPHLVVEVTQKRTIKHKLLCQAVLDAIKTKQLSIIQSKGMMKQLMIEHKVPLAVPGMYLNIAPDM